MPKTFSRNSLASFNTLSGIATVQNINANHKPSFRATRKSVHKRVTELPSSCMISSDIKSNAAKIKDKLKNAASIKYNGKTFREWDMSWENIGILVSANTRKYNSVVGLYRMVLNGSTVYVGRATELMNGGLRKRLNDYLRDSSSARKHNSGQLIYNHRNKLTVFVLPVGSNLEAVEATKKLEGLFIAKYMPEWNKQINI